MAELSPKDEARARELAATVTDQQLEDYFESPSGRAWTSALGFACELTPIGKRAIAIARERRREVPRG